MKLGLLKREDKSAILKQVIDNHYHYHSCFEKGRTSVGSIEKETDNDGSRGIRE